MSGAVPPNGTNFGHISNAAYDAGVAQAAKISGTAGCSAWLAAEANLVRDADVIPFANQVIKFFGAGAKFQVTGEVIPTSIRMTKS
jgi:peptide/nickel transport system substrate-binding protein